MLSPKTWKRKSADVQQPERDDDTERPTRIAIAVDGCLAEDRRCFSCGYNLRGLLPGGTCPECNTPVVESLKGVELDEAPLPWLRGVARGFRCLKFAILILLITPISVMMFMAFGGQAQETAGILLGCTVMLTLPLGGLLALVGFVQATRVEPRVAALGESWTARRISRVMLVAAIGLSIASGFIGPVFGYGAIGDFVASILRPIFAIVSVVALLTFTEYIVKLLERTADVGTLRGARQTRGVARVAAGLVAVSFLGEAAMRTFKGIPRETQHALEGITQFSGGCGACLWLIMGIGFAGAIFGVSRVLDRIVRTTEQRSNLPVARPIPRETHSETGW